MPETAAGRDVAVGQRRQRVEDQDRGQRSRRRRQPCVAVVSGTAAATEPMAYSVTNWPASVSDMPMPALMRSTCRRAGLGQQGQEAGHRQRQQRAAAACPPRDARRSALSSSSCSRPFIGAGVPEGGRPIAGTQCGGSPINEKQAKVSNTHDSVVMNGASKHGQHQRAARVRPCRGCASRRRAATGHFGISRQQGHRAAGGTAGRAPVPPLHPHDQSDAGRRAVPGALPPHPARNGGRRGGAAAQRAARQAHQPPSVGTLFMPKLGSSSAAIRASSWTSITRTGWWT